jgi:hypothetical protein
MTLNAVICEIINTVSILVKEELKAILINICKNCKNVVFGLKLKIFSTLKIKKKKTHK